MTLITMPDAEQVVIRALLGMTELSGRGGRIYSFVPKQRTLPLARVARYGGDPLHEGHPYWLDSPSMQVDVWDDRTAVAQTLAESLRACCSQRLQAAVTGAVVSNVAVSALIQTADSVFNPPKPRYIFTMRLVLHP